MNKEKLQDYIQKLKNEAKNIDQNAQNRIKQELENKGKFVYSFTFGEYLYALSKKINDIAFELTQILEEKEQ